MGLIEQLEVAPSVVASAIGLNTAPSEALPALLDQSLDCIKLISCGGTVEYMNVNGLCAMEVDNFVSVAGQRWSALWPEEARSTIEQALVSAEAGEAVRFEAFCPTAKGSSRWWDVSVSGIADASGRKLGFLAVSRDVTQARLAKEVAEIATAEMRHRLKNSYAMVGGLLAALARGVPEREEFVHEIRDRLSALGVAQTLFVARDHAPCDIADLMPALLEPFSHPHCPVVVAELPEVAIDQGQADALALVFGELAVNSSKHGALTANGNIGVSAIVQEDQLVVVWSERSTRAVTTRSRDEGQGLRLINRILSARNGSMTVDWREDGLDATISLRISPAP